MTTNTLAKWLCFIIAYALSTTPSRSDVIARDGVTITSLIRLIAHPEQYQGKRVQVRGYYVHSFEWSGVFLTREDAEMANVPNAVWVDSENIENMRIKKHESVRGYYLIIGTFHYNPKVGVGHLNAWHYSITNVTLFSEIKK